MNLEDKTTISRRDALKFGLASLGGLILTRCGGDASVNIPQVIDIGKEDVGYLEGQVFKPVVKGNSIIYQPVKGIQVYLQNTEGFDMKTISNGEYGFNDVPVGRRTIVVNDNSFAQMINGLTSAQEELLIKEGRTHTIDFQLDYNAKGVGTPSGILHGKIRWENGVPYSGLLNLHLASFSQGKYSPGSIEESKRTDLDGSFAFEITQSPYFLQSPEGTIAIAEGSNSGFINLSNMSGIIERNATIK